MRGNTTIRSGSSFVRSPIIDGFIPDSLVPKVYEKWEENDYPVEDYGGGVKGITCSHILDIGFKGLSKLFGPYNAKVLMEAAEKNDVT